MRYRLLTLALAAVWSTSFAVELPESHLENRLSSELLQLRYDGLNQALSASDFEEEPQTQSSGEKSVWKAALFSALLPGAGEFYIGQRKKARYFFAGELLTWIGYASFKTYANWKEEDFIRLAETEAGAQMDGKDQDFQDWLGFYDSIDEFNTLGRVFEPGRPYLEDTPENHWYWSSSSYREEYRHLKNRSREADRRADFMIGIAVINRVISVVDAVISARKLDGEFDNGFSSTSGFRLHFDPFSNTRQVQLTFGAGL